MPRRVMPQSAFAPCFCRRKLNRMITARAMPFGSEKTAIDFYILLTRITCKNKGGHPFS